MAAFGDPRLNRLLAALPEAEWHCWRPQLEPVDLLLGEVLRESGGLLTHMVFPATAVVSLLYVTEGGACAEIGVFGNEGVVGFELFMGGRTIPDGPSCKAPAVAFDWAGTSSGTNLRTQLSSRT